MPRRGAVKGDMDEWSWLTCVLSLTAHSAPPTACDELAQFLLICNHHCFASGFCTSKAVKFLH